MTGAGTYELVDHERVDDGPTASDNPHGLGELVRPRDTFFEQVGTAGRAIL